MQSRLRDDRLEPSTTDFQGEGRRGGRAPARTAGGGLKRSDARVLVDTRALRESAAGLPGSVADEMAVPSYTHPNPLIRWLMRKRLELSLDLTEGMHPARALDYGTGTGVLLRLLASISAEVIACDKDITAAARLSASYGLANVRLSRVLTLPIPLPDASVDLAFCLDVLEHVNDLQGISRELSRVLRPDALLIVSGPTENLLYKLGRVTAGFAGKGDYHHWNVGQVFAALEENFTLRDRRRLFFFLRLFEVASFRRRPPADGPAASGS
jgi:SAM-dependent methyltransferase